MSTNIAEVVESKKRKFNEVAVPEKESAKDLLSSLPPICQQLILQQLPIESSVSAALTSRAWYDILSSNKLCYHKSTKLTLSDENQLVAASTSRILRHVNRIEIGAFKRGLSIRTLINDLFQFTSLFWLNQLYRICFVQLRGHYRKIDFGNVTICSTGIAERTSPSSRVPTLPPLLITCSTLSNIFFHLVQTRTSILTKGVVPNSCCRLHIFQAWNIWNGSKCHRKFLRKASVFLQKICSSLQFVCERVKFHWNVKILHENTR